MPIVYSVLVYRETPEPLSMSVLSSERFTHRDEAEAYARSQEGGEMKATVHPLCVNGVHPIGRRDDGVDFCQQCDRKTSR